MAEAVGITLGVLGACGLALWLMLRPGSLAHRARQDEAAPTVADEHGATPPRPPREPDAQREQGGPAPGRQRCGRPPDGDR